LHKAQLGHKDRLPGALTTCVDGVTLLAVRDGPPPWRACNSGFGLGRRSGGDDTVCRPRGRAGRAHRRLGRRRRRPWRDGAAGRRGWYRQDPVGRGAGGPGDLARRCCAVGSLLGGGGRARVLALGAGRPSLLEGQRPGGAAPRLGRRRGRHRPGDSRRPRPSAGPARAAAGGAGGSQIPAVRQPRRLPAGGGGPPAAAAGAGRPALGRRAVACHAAVRGPGAGARRPAGAWHLPACRGGPGASAAWDPGRPDPWAAPPPAAARRPGPAGGGQLRCAGHWGGAVGGAGGGGAPPDRRQPVLCHRGGPPAGQPGPARPRRGGRAAAGGRAAGGGQGGGRRAARPPFRRQPAGPRGRRPHRPRLPAARPTASQWPGSGAAAGAAGGGRGGQGPRAGLRRA
jgi:hypothetical protein